MAYTFGANASDTVTFATGLFDGGRVQLLTAWFRPTALSVGQALAGTVAGNLGRVLIDSSAGALRLYQPLSTTQSQHTTPDGVLVLDEWNFVAIAYSSGTAAPWRMWRGDVGSAPMEIPLTVSVAGSGSNASISNIQIGNDGGNSSFVGQICDLRYFRSTIASGTANPFLNAAIGTITDSEAAHIFAHYVLPYWRGEHLPSRDVVITPSVASVVSSSHFWSGMIDAPVIRVLVGHNSASSQSDLSPTITGATYSEIGHPRPFIQHPRLRSPARR